VLVIRAMPDELRNVDMYLKATQLSVDRQVILEAKILEVELNDQFQSGINWAALRFDQGRHDRVSAGISQPGATLRRWACRRPAGSVGNGRRRREPGFSLGECGRRGRLAVRPGLPDQ
jgi:MSHA biogenesis protein MshL